TSSCCGVFGSAFQGICLPPETNRQKANNNKRIVPHLASNGSIPVCSLEIQSVAIRPRASASKRFQRLLPDDQACTFESKPTKCIECKEAKEVRRRIRCRPNKKKHGKSRTAYEVVSREKVTN